MAFTTIDERSSLKYIKHVISNKSIRSLPDPSKVDQSVIEKIQFSTGASQSQPEQNQKYSSKLILSWSK